MCYLYQTGLKVVIDLGQPIGRRVQSIYARCGNCTIIDYHRLDLNADYTVIMSTYLYKGGDGYTFNMSNTTFLSFGECLNFTSRFPLTIPNNCYFNRENGYPNSQRTDSHQVTDLARSQPKNYFAQHKKDAGNQ